MKKLSIYNLYQFMLNKQFILLVFLLQGQLLFSQNYAEDLVSNYIDSSDIELRINKSPSRAMHYILKAEQILKDEKIFSDPLSRRIEGVYATIFLRTGNVSFSIKHIKNIVNSLKQDANNQVNDNYFWYNCDLAKNYWDLDKDSAMKYYEIALYWSINRNNNFFEASAYNNLGMFCIANNELEKAYSYYMKASISLKEDSLITATKFLSGVMDICITDNLAEYFLIKKDTVKGIELIEKNVNILTSNFIKDPEIYKRTISYGIKLTELYILKRNLVEAKNILLSIIPHLDHNDLKWKVESEINIKKILIKLYKKEGNIEKAEELTEELDKLYKELIRIKEAENSNLSNSIHNYMLNSIDLELESIKQDGIIKEESARRKTIILIISILIALCFAFLLIINYKRKLKIESSGRLLKEKELELTTMESEKLAKDLQGKGKDLANAMMLNSLKSGWSGEVIEQLEKVSHGKASVEHYDIKEIIKQLKQKKPAYEIAETFQNGIEEEDTSFYGRLLEMFPNVTSGEKALCGLIRMKLTGKDIASIRNINPNSVKKMRQRLRKKLGLTLDQDLYDFIANI